ncbi:MAG TPA: metalloregulator ArsR/SmtB family transcription factor [Candidatus Nanoarchaeia archaeon]|nr:metalloregulator ArsR/SmtB family transcription factor [Candidatus Nanoarchaeia archaeon]
MIVEVDILKALADETRLKIIKLLLNGEQCVCKIQPKTGVTQSTTSNHLGKLEKAGIIKSRRDGKKIYYHISNETVINILKALGYKGSLITSTCCMDD